MNFHEQYHALRNEVCLFNFSAINKIKINGEEAENFIDFLCPGNVKTLNQYKIINNLFLNAQGKILFIFWLMRGSDHFFIHSESKKTKELFSYLNGNKVENVYIEDGTEKIGCLSIIGPKALALTKKIFGDDILGLSYLNFEETNWEDMKITICRCGGSGEFEYRLFTEVENIDRLEKKILDDGEEFSIVTIDEEALDLALLEMKTINQDEDLHEQTSPLQAGLHWMINFRKHNFVGKEALEKELNKGVTPKLLMTIFENFSENNKTKLIREIKDKDIYLEKERVGKIINVNFSPTLEKGIGLSFIKKEFAYAGLDFAIPLNGHNLRIKTVSSPLFITKTVSGKYD